MNVRRKGHSSTASLPTTPLRFTLITLITLIRVLR